MTNETIKNLIPVFIFLWVFLVLALVVAIIITTNQNKKNIELQRRLKAEQEYRQEVLQKQKQIEAKVIIEKEKNDQLELAKSFLQSDIQDLSTRYNIVHQNYSQTQSELSQIKVDIAEQKEHQQEVYKRRRVTSKSRENVLIRDNYTCQICGISKSFLDDLCPGLGDWLLLEIDHILPVDAGGTGEFEDNLQCLCWRCNRKKNKKVISNGEMRTKITYSFTKLFKNKKLYIR